MYIEESKWIALREKYLKEMVKHLYEHACFDKAEYDQIYFAGSSQKIL